jgi:histidine triad (HIT) family protein
MSDCPFCQLAEGDMPPHCLYENGRFFVLLDRGSLGVGHCMVIPRRHVAQVIDLNEDEYTALFLLAKKLAPHLQQAAGTRAVGYVVFGSGLPHAHLHLVPHNRPEQLEHPQPKTLSDDELRANATFLRRFLPEKL